MKKSLFAMSLLLAVTACATGVSAETVVENGVTYESAKVDDLRIVKYSPDKTDTEFTISNASVNDEAFEGAKNLERVTISDGVYYIGEYAFRDCTALTEVVFEGACGVSIPENAFDGCTSLDPAYIEELCWDTPFHDVFPQDRYYNAVKFVAKAGIMNGVETDLFAPDTGTTRAMFVTILGRLAETRGYDNADSVVTTFDDVEDGQWYTDYVTWAAKNDIVTGYGDGTFGVNDRVTIEQATVILARYAGITETSAYDMEEEYTDTDKISDWAKSAMRWAVASGIYSGYGNELRPTANAPRALIAEMLYNYVKSYPLTAEESVRTMKEQLITAYESYYNKDFVPTDTDVEPDATYGEEWDRYQISVLDETLATPVTEEYYKIPYVWGFYVNRYTGQVYVYYNGIDPFFEIYEPVRMGLSFAG